MIDQQHFDGVERLLDKGSKAAKGVFDEDEHQQRHDRCPKVRAIEKWELSALRPGRFEILPRTHHAHSDQR